jgi:hypothetical protein
MGRAYDFELAEAPHLALLQGAKPVPRTEVERVVRQVLEPFIRAVRRLKQAGLDRLMIHGLPPRSADQARSRQWTRTDCPVETRIKVTMLANRLLADAARDLGVGYLDVWPELGADGRMAERYDLDGVHVTREGAVIALEKIIGLLLSENQGFFNEDRYRLIATPGPKSSAETDGHVARYRETGALELRIDPKQVLRMGESPRFEPQTGNRHARMCWSGSFAPAPDAPALASPRPGDLDLLHNVIADVLPLIETCLDYQATVYACHPLSVTAVNGRVALVPAIAPPRSAIALLFLDGDSKPCLAFGGAVPRSIAPQPGLLVLADPARTTVSLEATTTALRVIRLCLGPRHPNEPFRVVWSGLNEWPKDPFQYSVRGCLASPAYAAEDISYRAPGPR